MTKRSAKSYAKETDEWLFIITGKRIRDIAKRVIDLYGEDVVKAVEKLLTGGNGAVAPEDSPYTVLGLLPDASDAVVKAAFRAAAFDYHPDTGKTPDKGKFQKAVEARDVIMLARKLLKEKEKYASDHAKGVAK